MSRWFYGILFLITVIICSADGCDEDPEIIALREVQYTTGRIDSVRFTFTADSITFNELKAYETTARQKLSDLSDYLNIITDTTLDLRIRQQAYNMILDLFIPGEPVVKQLAAICPDWKSASEDLLHFQGTPEVAPCRIRPSGIIISEPFARKNDSTYKGTLSFYQQNHLPVKVPEEQYPTGSYTIDIYLIRNIKTFGSQHLKVWDTYLGHIDWEK
jgi:hypothetical protein